MKLNEYIIINNSVIPLREDEQSSPDAEDLINKITELHALDAESEDAVSIDEADRVIAPDGQIIDMQAVRSIIDDAIDQLTSMIDPLLINYFNYINIIYTWQVETFATSTQYLFINPSFLMNVFAKGDIPFVAYILLHECYHVIMGHCDDPKWKEKASKGEREQWLANLAQDLQINWMIENSTFADDDDTGDTVYPFDGMTKEIGGAIDNTYSCLDWPKIYDILEELNPSNIQQEGEEFAPETEEPDEKSDDWYKGFLEGIKELYDTLRKNGLIESLKMKPVYTALNEEEIYDYDDDMDTAIKKILSSSLSTAEKARLIYAASKRKDDEFNRDDSGLRFGSNNNDRTEQGNKNQSDSEQSSNNPQDQQSNNPQDQHIGRHNANDHKSSGQQRKSIDDLRNEKRAQSGRNNQTIDSADNNGNDRSDIAMSDAEHAEQAAQRAEQAAQRAEQAELQGNSSKAQEAAQAAANAARQAESANQQAGGEDISQNKLNGTSVEQARQAAEQARQSAKAARDAAEQAKQDAQLTRDTTQQKQQGDASLTTKTAEQRISDNAQRMADAAQKAANAAQKAADAAREAANAAQKAADAAQSAESNGDTKGAESFVQNAKDSAMQAEQANQQAGGKPVNQDTIDNKGSFGKQAENMAQNANQSANNAQKAADNAQAEANKAQAEADKAQAEADKAWDNLNKSFDKNDSEEMNSANNKVSSDEKRKAAKKAENAKQLADNARQAAEQAQKHADLAKNAADKSMEEENRGNKKGAEENSRNAKNASEDANKANKKAGGDDVFMRTDPSLSDAEQAMQAAEQAQQAADNARQAADNAQAEAERLEAESAQLEVEDSSDDSKKNSTTYTEFDEGKSFGLFVGGLIYKNDGKAKDILDAFRKTMVLPDVPDIKLKSRHVSESDETLDKIWESEEDDTIARIMRAIEAGGNTDDLLSGIMDALTLGDEIGNNGEHAERSSEDTNKIPRQQIEVPQVRNPEKIDNSKQRVKITTADGKYTGRARFNDGRHAITNDEANDILNKRDAMTPRAKHASNMKKTHSKIDSTGNLFNAIGGQFNVLDSICKRSIGRGIEIDGLPYEELQKRKEGYSAEIMGRIQSASHNIVPWNNILRDYLKGTFTKDKEGYTAVSMARVAYGRRSGEKASLRPKIERGSTIGNKLVVFLDTSGSVLGTQGKINQVLAEIAAIGKERVNIGRGQTAPFFKKMDVLLFNDEVDEANSLYNVSTSDIAKINGMHISSGGTSYPPVYTYIYDNYVNDKEVSAILFISDSDLLWYENRFNLWMREYPAEGKEVAKLGPKTVFFAFYDGHTAQDYKYAMLPNAKIKVLEKESVLHESINNNDMIKHGYYVINEAGFKLRGAKPAAAEKVKPSAVSVDTADSVDTEEPATVVINNEPEDTSANISMSDIVKKIRSSARETAAASGSHVFNKDIHEWIKAVYGWRLKEVNTSQEVRTLPQTYCVSGSNKIYINNETFDEPGKHKAEVYALKRKNGDWLSSGSKYDYLVPADEKQENGEILSKMPKTAFRTPYVDADIEVLSYRGNLIVDGYDGELLPKFMPKRILKGSYDYEGCGNLTIMNCRNLSTFDNFPTNVEGVIRIYGCPKLKDPVLLNKYKEDVEAATGGKNKVRCI